MNVLWVFDDIIKKIRSQNELEPYFIQNRHVRRWFAQHIYQWPINLFNRLPVLKSLTIKLFRFNGHRFEPAHCITVANFRQIWEWHNELVLWIDNYFLCVYEYKISIIVTFKQYCITFYELLKTGYIYCISFKMMDLFLFVKSSHLYKISKLNQSLSRKILISNPLPY